MSGLDFNRPYGTVSGLAGVSYQQNQKYYRHDGSEVLGDPDKDREVRELKAMLSDPRVDFEARQAARARLDYLEPVIAPQGPDDEPRKPHGWSEDDLRRPDNKALKAQLETYGEEWTTRKAALEFLQKGRE